MKETHDDDMDTFYVLDHFCGESSDQWWIPSKKASNA